MLRLERNSCVSLTRRTGRSGRGTAGRVTLPSRGTEPRNGCWTLITIEAHSRTDNGGGHP